MFLEIAADVFTGLTVFAKLQAVTARDFANHTIVSRPWVDPVHFTDLKLWSLMKSSISDWLNAFNFGEMDVK